MAQYRVEYKAFDRKVPRKPRPVAGELHYPEISRGITVQEFLEAMEWAEKYGLNNLDPQSVSVRNFYRRSK